MCDLQAAAALAAGGTWNRSGVSLFGSAAPNQPIYRVSENGGMATPVTTRDPARNERGHWHPVFLPEGRHFFFMAVGHV